MNICLFRSGEGKTSTLAVVQCNGSPRVLKNPVAQALAIMKDSNTVVLVDGNNYHVESVTDNIVILVSPNGNKKFSLEELVVSFQKKVR